MTIIANNWKNKGAHATGVAIVEHGNNIGLMVQIRLGQMSVPY